MMHRIASGDGASFVSPRPAQLYAQRYAFE